MISDGIAISAIRSDVAEHRDTTRTGMALNVVCAESPELEALAKINQDKAVFAG